MSSSTPTTPPSDAPSSSPTSSAPEISPRPLEAQFLFLLMERYHQVAQIFKVLREDRQSQVSKDTPLMSTGERENARVAATGLFNHLYVLVQSRFLTPQGFSLVIAPQAARMWLELVAPLDAAVRQAAAARSGGEATPLGEHPIDRFYQRYAETGGVLLRVPAAPDPYTH